MVANLLPLFFAGSSLLQGINQNKAYKEAAAAAKEAAEFNATLIERDAELLGQQQEVIKRNFAVTKIRKGLQFKALQGTVKAQTAFSGFDIAQGTPVVNLRKNANEFNFEKSVDEFNAATALQQLEDQKESSKLNAELMRMEGGEQYASLRSQGTSSLLASFSGAAQGYKAMGGTFI